MSDFMKALTAVEFRKKWQQQNPNTIHIPSEHEIMLMEKYARYYANVKIANEQIKEQETALNKHSVSFSEERVEVCELPNFDIEKMCLKCGLHISEHPNIHKQT